jgi:hypothetical protein
MSVIKEADKSRKTNRIQMWLIFLIGAALALALIFPLRGIMNAVSRLDYISQRLDDYPHMKTVYLQETREWSNWWQKEVSGYRAGQAAYIFAADEKHQSEEEKLSYIAGILNAEKAQIIPEAEYQSIAGAASEETPGRSFAKLSDGRVIMLEFADSSESERLKKEEEDTLFLSQVEAGLPGYGPCRLGDFPGISHAILERPLDRDRAEDLVRTWCRDLKTDALGLMLLDRKERTMTPLVYVPAAGTLFWENSCASGTSAVGAGLAEEEGAPLTMSLAQPGGSLTVEVSGDGSLSLTGRVRFLARKEAELDL